MISYGPFPLAVGKNPTQTISGYPVSGKLVVLNESLFTLRVNCNEGNVKTVAAFTADIIVVAKDFYGQVDVTASADLTTQGAAPAMIMYIEAYGATEDVSGSYPATLVRLVSVGNQVGTVSQLTQIINSGEGVPNDIIKDTPTGFSTPTVHLTNDGIMDISGSTAGEFKGVTAAAGSLAEVKGLDLQNGNGIETFGSNPADLLIASQTNIRLKIAAAGHVGIHSAGGSIAVICDASAHGSIKVSHVISASGTITHGLGYQPTEVNTECAIAGSNTTNHDSVSSTTYHVTLGAAQTNVSYAG